MLSAICLSLSLLSGAALADQSSYGAPATGGSAYAAPATGYASPQTGYEQDYTGYTAPTAPEPQGEGLDIFGKIEELLPLFVAVLAAIILAQILAPLLGGLLGLFVAILPGALTPKAIIINLILGFFGLQLCTTASPPVAFPGGRSMADTFSEQARNFGFDLTDDQTNIIADFASQALDAIRSHYSSEI
jgi:hypothetical protein